MLRLFFCKYSVVHNSSYTYRIKCISQARRRKENHLRYVFSENLTSGESHDKENVTVRTEPEGTVTEAAMAAPMDDPGSEGKFSSHLSWSNDLF